MPSPNRRIMRCRMIKPDRQNFLRDSWIVESLTAAIRQDHEVELDSYGQDGARSGEVGHINGMYRTTQQNQRPGIEAILGGKHGDAAAMAMGYQIRILNGVSGQPRLKLGSRDRSRRLAISARPRKRVRVCIQVGTNPIQ